MNVRKRYKKIFGSIESLGEPIPWTTGLSNMFEWLTWDPKAILGVPKTSYWKQIVRWCSEPEPEGMSVEAKFTWIKKCLVSEMQESEQPTRYLNPVARVRNPREALRCAKYFSEDYLNKEFDIFWILVSDRYLDSFYGELLPLRKGGSWATHGNSGLFHSSTGIGRMQMDNLSYNRHEQLLGGNELKLGGKKNPDQVLKYAFMASELRRVGFIDQNDRFALVFIGDKEERDNWNETIDKELEHCAAQDNKAFLLDSSVVETARNATYASTTWLELAAFNDRYLLMLADDMQVERKLLEGFNFSLRQKKFMQDGVSVTA